MPNLTKGRGITGLVRYVMGQGNDKETGKRLELVPGETSRAEILGGQNFVFEIDSAERVEMARRVMEWNGLEKNQASTRRKCTQDALRASLSWEEGQEPTKAEMIEAAQSYLKALGMEKAQAVFVAHRDTEHTHIHIVASRINPETGKTFSQENDYEISQRWALQWERERGQISQNESRKALHRMLDAIEARDGASIVANLTERTPTFTARELDTALKYGNLTKDERAKFRADILAQANVIGLRETAESAVTRYTTREVLASEMALQRNARDLANDHTHGVNPARIAATAAEFTLKPEQADALAHLTQSGGFAMLWGEAGTGKSHTIKAVRSVYEAEGSKVIGLAWTHKVVKQMRGDGFTNAATIAGELKQIESGRSAWNSGTVVIVDEAAMIATEHLAKLASAARQAGAKLILAGDDHQLSSIDRGGMFETLRQSFGAAILEEVQRVGDVEQKSAFNKMHKGKFRDALQVFDKNGGLHWTEKQADALRDMAASYAADLAAAPDKRRFMFAFTNAEVDALNIQARAMHRQRGDLGADHELKSGQGAAQFATGDRIQFTGNGRTKKEQHAGLTNGNVGTITAIEAEEGHKPRVTVQLDTGKGDKPQSVTFTVGDNGAAGEFFNRFKLGYAGTIYKGQGDTLDQTYVLHSAQWKSSAAYVALTRHRESVQIFASRETMRGMESSKGIRAGFAEAAARASLDVDGFADRAKALDLATMARGMERRENKRAATAYRIDNDAAIRAELEATIATLADPREGRSRPLDEARPTTAPASRAEAQEPPTPRLTALQRLAAAEAAEAAEGAAIRGAVAEGAKVIRRTAAGAARVADALADTAGKAIEALADLFGGGSAPVDDSADAPPPAAEAPLEATPEAPAPSRHEERLAAFREQQSQLQDALRALARAKEPEQGRSEDKGQERDRDRGGGQSL